MERSEITTEAEHVPGPWELAWEDGKYGVVADSVGGKLICVIGNNPDDGLNDIRKANAILMASAPTMKARIAELEADLAAARAWINDLQSGMYINCVYCGHRYGPSETTPVSMADALKTHIEQCPKHPMSALKAEVARLESGRWIPIKDDDADALQIIDSRLHVTIDGKDFVIEWPDIWAVCRWQEGQPTP